MGNQLNKDKLSMKILKKLMMTFNIENKMAFHNKMTR